MIPRALLNPVIALLLVVAGSLQADPLNEDKPFAEYHLLLQVSDASPQSQDRVLNIANNLIGHYGGPDMIDIQVIAFAEGVQMLRRDDNPNRQRIEALITSGIRFRICQNTLDAIERSHGEPMPYLDDVVPVAAGVAHILEETRRGYTLVRP